MENKKIIVYTANIGGYDYFNTPKIIDENVRYIMFTDNKIVKSDVWEINHIDFLDDSITSRKKARYLKINPHKVLPNHDISIWIDHCFTPRFNNTDKLLKDMLFYKLNSEIMIFKHSWRNCIYTEAVEVINQKLDDPSVVKSQMRKYLSENFPPNLGLFETGFIVRNNNEKVNLFNETWWSEVSEGSGRDQLSNVYAAWKTKLPITRLERGESCYNNPFLEPKQKHIVKLRF
jgi:hypothetical protein